MLATSLLLTWCRLFTPSPRRLVLATSFVPFAVIGYLAATAVLLIGWRLTSGRLRKVAAGLAVASLLGSLGHLGLMLPSYVGAHPSGKADLVVMTSNLRLGRADTAAVARVVVDQHVDVLVAEEVTPEVLATLRSVRASLPYEAGLPAPGAFGTVVFSRYPVSDATRLPVSKGTWRLRVHAPTPFWFVGVHTAQPLSKAAMWHTDHARVLAALRGLSGPVVAAGDFNATLDHRPMRRLLAAGYADAARQANAGWQPTWPGAGDADGALPFGMHVLTLDHVLVRKVSAISTSAWTIPRSDHRALVARLMLR